MLQSQSYPVIPAEITALKKIISQANDTPEGWQNLCDALARCAGGVGTAFLSINPEDRGHGVIASSSLDAVTAAYIEGGWYLEDQRQSAIPKMLERGYCDDSDIASLDVLRKQPFYSGFLQRFELGGFIGVHFKVGQRDWCAAIQFGASRFKPREGFIDHIAEISAKLTQVATISMLEAADYWQNLRITYREMGCELVPFDPFGKVIGGLLARNETGTEKVSDPMPWAGRLIEGDSVSHFVDQDVKTWLASGGDLPPPNTVTQVDGANLSCVYLNSPVPMRFFAIGVAGILSLSQVSGVKDPARDFARRISLTPAETRVIEALAIGDDTKEIAHKLALTDGTVRQYLKSVFRKAEVRSQHQLVAAIYMGAR